MRKQLRLDLDRGLGPVRPLHGIDNGPVCFGSLIDSTELYQAAGFPFIRLHDSNWPHPREVDVPQIFPDFSADPDDPASYDFRRTDAYLEQCLATGAELIYRLGVSIEHTRTKQHTHPPADAEKWATVCLNIIRHCNAGWADGHRWGIRYWEIWNEPDNQFFAADRSTDPMWSGTPEQYFDLYAITARKLKTAFPELKIGGYGASRLDARYLPFFDAFLDRIARDRLPLDFLSWHRYAADPEDFHREALAAEAGLDRIGYAHTESVCDEWNYVPAAAPPEARPLAGNGRAAHAHGSFTAASGHAGTSACAATMMRLHDTRCAIATHYDGQPTNYYCTILDRYGYPQKPFYAFVMYRELYALRRRIAVSGAGDGLYALSAGDASALGLLLTSFRTACQIDLEIPGLVPGASYRLRRHLTDAAHCHALVEDRLVEAPVQALSCTLEEKATTLITLTRVTP